MFRPLRGRHQGKYKAYKYKKCCQKYSSVDIKVQSMFPKIALVFHRTSKYEMVKKKGKAVPLQAWSGPEGSRKLRFPDFMTTAEDGGKAVSPPHRLLLPPGNAPGTHFC